MGDDKWEKLADYDLGRIANALEALVKFFTTPAVTDFVLHQIIQGEVMAINGTVVGTTSTFQIGFVPAMNFVPLPTPPIVAVDDTANVTLGPVSTDGQFTFTAAVAAADPNKSYNVTVSGTNDKGVAITHTFNIPVLPTPPPPPTSVTDFSLNQLS